MKMTGLKVLLILTLIVSFWSPLQVAAQVGSYGTPGVIDGPRSDLRSTISPSDAQKLHDIYAFKKQLDSNDPKENDPKEIEKRHQEALSFTAAEISNLGLACQVENAKLAGVTGAKKTKDVKSLYEVSCSNGMGYLLVTQPKEPSVAISCFSAEATKAADLASGKDSLLYCQLPENTDLKINAKKILNQAKIDCDPDNVRWFGQSASKHIEYTEVSCTNKSGYLIASGLASNKAEPSAINCVESAKQGLACTLTKTSVVTIEDIVAGLAKNGLKCAPEKIHVFGREKIRQRHVVEAICEGKPASVIAFVPVVEQSAPFESMSCEDALKAGIKCTMSK